MAFQVQILKSLPKLPGQLEWQVVGDGESGDMVFRRSEVLDWSRSNQYACLVTSCAPGVCASALSPPDLLKAWPSIAEKFRQFHQLPSESCQFERRLLQVVETASDVVRRNVVNKDFFDDADKDTPVPGLQRLAFYLKLDPLTWG